MHSGGITYLIQFNCKDFLLLLLSVCFAGIVHTKAIKIKGFRSFLVHGRFQDFVFCLFVLLCFWTIDRTKAFGFCLFVMLCFWTIGKIKAFGFCLFVLLCFWTIGKINAFRSFVVLGRFQDFVFLSVCFALFLDN